MPSDDASDPPETFDEAIENLVDALWEEREIFTYYLFGACVGLVMGYLAFGVFGCG